MYSNVKLKLVQNLFLEYLQLTVLYNRFEMKLEIFQVTQQDLADTYQPPFRSCVQEGKASGIMCADNSVNGVPNCADHNLLTQTARVEWGFHG